MIPLGEESSTGLVEQDPSPYYSPQGAREKAMLRYVEDTSKDNDFSEQVLPQFDWGTKALESGAKANELTNQSAINQIKNSVSSLPTYTPSGQLAGGSGKTYNGVTMAAILRALSGKESGGNYGAVNPHSGALGKYQVMPSNIQGAGSGWDHQALGRDVTTQQFLNQPKLQEAIVRHIFGGYLDNHGLAGALSSWYSGDPNKWNSTASQSYGGHAYPSIYNYVASIFKSLGLKPPKA